MGLLSPIFFVLIAGTVLPTEIALASLFRLSTSIKTSRELDSLDFDIRAQSIGFLVSKKTISSRLFSSVRWLTAFSPSETRLNLCLPTTEVDHETYPGVSCTVFLVAPDLAVTASHCFESLKCGDAQIVFSDLKTKNSKTEFSKNDVFSCKRLKIGSYLASQRRVEDRKGDWALIQLDRKANRPILATSFSQDQSAEENFSNSKSVRLEYLGYLFGQSLKRYEGQDLTELRAEGVASTTLSATGGSSGAPVFARTSSTVLGLVVSGGRIVKPSSSPTGALCNELVNCDESESENKIESPNNCSATRVLLLRSEMLHF